MSIDFNFKVLIDKMNKLNNKVQNKISKEALVQGGNVILKLEKRYAPRDTGELEHSLKVSNIKRRKGNKIIQIGNIGATGDVLRYAYYQNYGYRSKGGLFFIQRAFEKGERDAIQAMKKVIIAGITK